jgi:hypothetical protein
MQHGEEVGGTSTAIGLSSDNPQGESEISIEKLAHKPQMRKMENFLIKP